MELEETHPKSFIPNPNPPKKPKPLNPQARKAKPIKNEAASNSYPYQDMSLGLLGLKGSGCGVQGLGFRI